MGLLVARGVLHVVIKDITSVIYASTYPSPKVRNVKILHPNLLRPHR